MGRDGGTLTFGEFELDAGRLELRRNGRPVELQPMPLRVLLYLAEHRDRTVPTRELLDKLWAGTIVTDTALANAVSQARQAVGDDGRAQRVIRTHKGHGYRFVAEVDPGLGVRPTLPGLPLTSIAVLPFDDMSPGGEQRWLAEGVSEDLRESISRIKQLRVIAGLSSELAVATESDVPTIGRRLEVGAIVEGSVRRIGDQVRVTVELIRAADESRLWSARYDRSLDDGALAIQHEIAREIAESIRSELGVEERVSWLNRGRYATEDPRAYELLRRSTEIGKLSISEEGLRAATAYAQQAVEIDPNYSTAYSELAFCHYLLWQFGYERGDAALSAARAAAHRALELDETDPGPHELLAAESMREWNFEAAESRLQKAIEQSPNYSGLRHVYAYLLVQTGRMGPALVQARRSVAIDPLFSGRHWALGRILSFAGRDDAAIASYEKVLELDPAFPFAGLELASVYHAEGRDTEALEAFLRDSQVQRDPELERSLRRAFDVGGWTALNGAMIAALETQTGKTCGTLPNLGALLYARAGDAERMYQCLDQAVTQKGNSELWLSVHPSWNPYREEPRFQALLRRVGLAG